MSDFLHTSDILRALATRPDDRLSVRDLLSALEARAFALLIVVLGVPNCLPMPPPIPLVCGLLLFAVSLQMIFGLAVPWFPPRVARQSIARADLTRAVTRALPVVLWLERLSRHRYSFLDGKGALRVAGLLLLVLSVGLIFAAPFVGQIPMGISICLLGLGMVERDGLVVMAGLFVGVIGLMLSAGFVWTLFRGIVRLFQ